MKSVYFLFLENQYNYNIRVDFALEIKDNGKHKKTTTLILYEKKKVIPDRLGICKCHPPPPCSP